MRPAKPRPPEAPPVIAKMRTAKGRRETKDTWRYWEIVGDLIWMGADRLDAYDAARWCIRAKPGETRAVKPDIEITIE